MCWSYQTLVRGAYPFTSPFQHHAHSFYFHNYLKFVVLCYLRHTTHSFVRLLAPVAPLRDLYYRTYSKGPLLVHVASGTSTIARCRGTSTVGKVSMLCLVYSNAFVVRNQTSHHQKTQGGRRRWIKQTPEDNAGIGFYPPPTDEWSVKPQ